jgi:hypothetical protein
MRNKTGIHYGNPETSSRCKTVYDFLVARGSVGATSLELALAFDRYQVAASTTVSELRNWARKTGRSDLTFPCVYEGKTECSKVYRYWLRDYSTPVPA